MLSVKPRKKNEEIVHEESVGLIKHEKEPEITEKQINELETISHKISEGANIFLWSEYFYLSIFIFLLSILVHFCAENSIGQFYTTIAFITGAFTSIIC